MKNQWKSWRLKHVKTCENTRWSTFCLFSKAEIVVKWPHVGVYIGKVLSRHLAIFCIFWLGPRWYFFKKYLGRFFRILEVFSVCTGWIWKRLFILMILAFYQFPRFENWWRPWIVYEIVHLSGIKTTYVPQIEQSTWILTPQMPFDTQK